MTESKTENLPTYAPSYKVIDHCLLETKNSKQGPYDKKLCNFIPWITSEVNCFCIQKIHKRSSSLC